MSENSVGASDSDIDGQEPSMEDILASIRKIISDDEVTALDTPSSTEDKQGLEASFVGQEVVDRDFDFGVSDTDFEALSSGTDIANNEFLVDEFDSNELDELLSFKDLEIPEAAQGEDHSVSASNSFESFLNTTESVGVDAARETLDLESTDILDMGDESSETIDLDMILAPVVSSKGAPSLSAKNVDPDDDLFLSALVEEPIEEETGLETAHADQTDTEVTATDIPSEIDDLSDMLDLSDFDFEFDDNLAASDVTILPENSEPVTLPTAQFGSDDGLDANYSSEKDIDLVKSLMADLTDDSFLDAVDTDAGAILPLETAIETVSLETESNVSQDDVLNALPDIFEENSVAVAEEEASIMDEILSFDEDDISVGDIELATDLNFDLETHVPSEEILEAELPEFDPPEFEVSEADDAIVEPKADPIIPDFNDLTEYSEVDDVASGPEFSTLLNEFEPIQLNGVEAGSELLDVAQRAEAAALDAETPDVNIPIIDQVWVKDLVADILPSTADTEEDETEIASELESPHSEVETDEITEDITQSDTPFEDRLVDEIVEQVMTEDFKEKLNMPKAMRSDTILDEVTQRAASVPFAELNQVVEEKAIYEERGDRIGDLVQQALRPMLKDWLDENLKGIVERAVAKEVKRISTGK